MSRELDPSVAAALSSGAIQPFFMAQLSFKSQMVYCWTGVGNLTWNNQTFVGVGSMGKIGVITEGVDVHAYGTSVTLSGIDPVLLGECMTDMVPGAPALLWFGLLANGNVIGQPYQVFRGTMDQPTIRYGVDTVTIDLALETRMLDLSRANNLRYTSASQRVQYPTDTAFGWVESLNDQALVEGS